MRMKSGSFGILAFVVALPPFLQLFNSLGYFAIISGTFSVVSTMVVKTLLGENWMASLPSPRRRYPLVEAKYSSQS